MTDTQKLLKELAEVKVKFQQKAILAIVTQPPQHKEGE